MKKLFVMFTVMCFVVAMSSCGHDNDSDLDINEYAAYEYQEESAETEEGETEEGETYINYENLPEPVEINADFSVTPVSDGTFIIETNLPDETELMLTLKGRGYLAQGHAYVENGTAVSERFTDQGERLWGDFVLEVLMPIPNVQSDYVKHFIGSRGQYLTGPYVKPSLGSVVVMKEFEVSIPTEDEAESETQEETEVGGASQKRNDNESEKEETEVESSGEQKVEYYVTPTGKRYHSNPTCGGKNSYKTSNISGLTPCKKCFN